MEEEITIQYGEQEQKVENQSSFELFMAKIIQSFGIQNASNSAKDLELSYVNNDNEKLTIKSTLELEQYISSEFKSKPLNLTQIVSLQSMDDEEGHTLLSKSKWERITEEEQKQKSGQKSTARKDSQDSDQELTVKKQKPKPSKKRKGSDSSEENMTQKKKGNTKNKKKVDSDEEEEEEKGGKTDEPVVSQRFLNKNAAHVDETFKLIEDKRILSNETQEQFSYLDPAYLIAQATKNQVLHIIETPTVIDYEHDSLNSIKSYISSQGYNYSQIDNIQFLAKGGESYCLRLEVKQPVELVAKMVLPGKDSTAECIANILAESHMIKLLENSEHVVEIFEEIIEYNKQTNQIENYVCLVEQARCDLSNIVKTWSSEKQSLEKQEYFSEEKLFYFLFKTSQALDYLHQKKVYYGDMKEQNILVFRDYSIKIGDFGISIKLREEVEDENDDSYPLKGLTKGYTSLVVQQMFDDGADIERKLLILNDYYSLFKTFDNIYSLFQDKIDKNSYFYLMMTDIGGLSQSKKTLSQCIQQYKEKVEGDSKFINTLCDQIIAEEKILALPNVLQLSKHSTIARKVQEYFQSLEFQEFSFLKPHQISEIEEDKHQMQTSRNVIMDKSELISDLQVYISKFPNFYPEFGMFIERLIHYRLSFRPQIYNQFYRDLFDKFYQITFMKKATHLGIFESDQSMDYEGMIMFKDENKLAFDYYSVFYAFTFELDNTPTYAHLDKIIKIHESKGTFELEVKIILQLAKFIMNLKGYSQRVSQLAERMALVKSLNQQVAFFDELNTKIMLCESISKVNEKTSQFKFEIDEQFKKVSETQFYSKLKQNSLITKMYEVYANNGVFEDISQRLDYLLQFRKVYSHIFGQLGNVMSENAFRLYQEYKRIGDSENMFSFLDKACTFSLKEQRLSYLIIQCEEYKLIGDSKMLQNTLEKYKDVEEIFYLMFAIFYNKIETNVELKREELQKQLADYSYYYKYRKVFASDHIFKQAFLKVIQKEDQDESNFRTTYEDWQLTYNLAQIINHLQNSDYMEKQEYSFELENQIKFKGIVENKKLMGDASITFKDGRILTTSFESNELHGPFVYQFPDSSKYEGEYDSGQRQGEFIFDCLDSKIVGKYAEDREFGQFIITYSNGSNYKGYFKNGFQSGKGEMTYLDKSKYEGEWKMGTYWGKGILTFIENNYYYKGDFVNGVYHGQGEMTNNNGKHGKNVYEGEWADGRRHGIGKLASYYGYKNYEGEFQNGKKHGKGKLTMQHQFTYEGDFMNNKFHGQGKKTSPYGDSYEGEWKNGLKCGQGKDCAQGRKFYEGEFENDKPNGYGVQTEGTVRYEGNFKDGEYHGFGKLIDSGRNFEYEGEFKEGKKHGKGTFKDISRFQYTGDFEDDLMQGEGEKIFEDGKKYIGGFKKNEFSGKGYKFNKENDYYDGEWLNGRHHGQGIKVYNDKKKYEGGWEDDHYHGFGILQEKEGEIYEGEWIKGRRHGKGKQTKQGKLLYEGEYHDDQYDGEGTLTESNKTYVGGFKNGRESGFGKEVWHNRTEQTYEGWYLNGNYEGEGTQVNAYGEKYTGGWKSKQYHGKGRFESKEGNVYDGEYQKGKKHGQGAYTSKAGEIYIGGYENNEKHGEGKLTRLDGSYYEGGFNRDQECGQGIKTFKNKDRYEGGFDYGRFKGEGKLIYGSGCSYVGNFDQGEYHGEGVLTYMDGSKFEGTWHLGQKVNRGKYTSSKGVVVEAEINQNKEFWGENLRIFRDDYKYEGEIQNHRRHGKGIYMMSCGTYQDGLWETDYFTGNGVYVWKDLRYEGDFVKNQHEGKGKLLDDNQNLYEGQFSKDRYHGFGTLKKVDGSIYTGNWSMGSRHGKGKQTLADGTVQEGNWEKDKFMGDQEQLTFDKMTSIQQANQLVREDLTKIKLEDKVKITFHEHELAKTTDPNRRWGCDGKNFYGKCQSIGRMKPGQKLIGWGCKGCDLDLCEKCVQMALKIEETLDPVKFAQKQNKVVSETQIQKQEPIQEKVIEKAVEVKQAETEEVKTTQNEEVKIEEKVPEERVAEEKEVKLEEIIVTQKEEEKKELPKQVEAKASISTYQDSNSMTMRTMKKDELRKSQDIPKNQPKVQEHTQSSCANCFIF